MTVHLRPSGTFLSRNCTDMSLYAIRSVRHIRFSNGSLHCRMTFLHASKAVQK